MADATLRPVAFIERLTPAKLGHILRHGDFERVVHMHAPAPVNPSAASTRVVLRSFKNAPASYLEHWRRVCDWANEILLKPDFSRRADNYLTIIDLPLDHARNALKKHLIELFSEDCKTFSACANGESAKRRVCFAREPFLLSTLAIPDTTFERDPEPAYPLKQMASFWGRAVHLFLRILAPTPRAPRDMPSRPTFMFDQMYSRLDDLEFHAFYRYFKRRSDVLYTCDSPKTEIFRFLRSEGKPAVVHVWGVRGIGRTLGELARLSRLVWTLALDRGLPMSVKVIFLKVFKAKLYYESLFRDHQPKFFLRVRADMETRHPIITAVAERMGVTHVGYSCGSYPVIISFYSVIDFHHYGLLGLHLKNDIYAGIWPDSITYSVLGPITVECADLPSAAPRSAGDKPVIGVFSTSTNDEFYLQDAFFREFVELARDAAADIRGRIVFKEKYEDKARLEWIRRSCDGKVPYEIVYHPGSGMKSGPGVIESSDIILAMGATTCAWEALSRKRKLLVYQLSWLAHPFEKYEPRLVVRDRNRFLERFRLMHSMDPKAYEAMIEPVVRACGKFSSGTLVEDFIDELESAGRD